MLCCKCKKREAIIFISNFKNNETINEGYCMICARHLGMTHINNFLDKLKNDKNKEKYISEINNQLNEIINQKNYEVFFNPESISIINDMMSKFININDPGDDSPQVNLKFNLDNFNIIPQHKENEDNEQQLEQSSESNSLKNNKKKRRIKNIKYLKLYGEDLTAKALNGKIDRVIGRDREIERVIQILNRRTKNNPCLIGEPGVGKTAIAEGLALKIVSEQVPVKLLDKEVFLLDLTALIAGTQFRGQFESRIKGLIEEIKNSENIILFIDEVHNLVGTGDSEGTMSAANILKPALSRGEIQVIGATTFNEYRKYIEKDSALERRFQPITINEPTIRETIDIILGVKDYYELFHNVNLDNNIVRQAVILSERYITDRFLPDKAIDLIDEACSCASLSNKDLNNYLKLKREILNKQDELAYLESQEVINYEIVAIQKANLLKMQEIQKQFDKNLFTINVNENHLVQVIELWTGIPAFKIKESEYNKLVNLKSSIERKVIGQEKAINELVMAVKRARVQIRQNIRPASFIFVGPTGVGKTRLAKVLAEELFEDVDPIIRLDMSEYMEKFSISKIIGSPPGYIGYDDGGQLTEKVRQKPYSVVLFDEIEKAHPDVMNILLQILDNGKITDSHGKQVSFENTIIIMTSNAGSYSKEFSIGFNEEKDNWINNKAKKALSDFLKPEFLARVDEIIYFKKLNKLDYKKISKILIEELKKDIMESKGINLIYSDSVIDIITEKSYNTVNSSARDIQKNIRKEIEDKLCEIIINNKNQTITEVYFDIDNNKNIFYNIN